MHVHIQAMRVTHIASSPRLISACGDICASTDDRIAPGVLATLRSDDVILLGDSPPHARHAIRAPTAGR